MSRTTVTLSADNLLWLQARARSQQASVSAVLNALVSEARKPRSVVGRVRIPQGDAGLARGQKQIRDSFRRSLARSSARRG